MDGSAGVDRGHEAKMEGDAHRRSFERTQHKRKARDEATIYSAFCTFLHIYCGECVKTQAKI